MSIDRTHDAVDGIIGAHPISHRLGEDRPEQPDRAAGGTKPTPYVGYAPFFPALHPDGRLAVRHVVHEGFHIRACHGGDFQLAEPGLDVFLDPAFVSRQGAGFLWRAATGHEPTSLGIRPIGVTQLRHGFRLPSGLFVRRRVSARYGLSQEANGFVSGGVWRPRRTMTADGKASQPPLCRAEHQHVGYGRADPPTGTEAAHGAIPDFFAWLQGTNLA